MQIVYKKSKKGEASKEMFTPSSSFSHISKTYKSRSVSPPWPLISTKSVCVQTVKYILTFLCSQLYTQCNVVIVTCSSIFLLFLTLLL